MSISIFVGSSVAILGIVGIAIFWYKMMMEYNDRRGMFFSYGFTQIDVESAIVLKLLSRYHLRGNAHDVIYYHDIQYLK